MKARIILCSVLLFGCAPSPEPPSEDSLAPAPMQLREGVTVTVEGERLEVRRTMYRWVLPEPPVIMSDGTVAAPARQPSGEFSDGVPAIAIDGLTPGPGDYDAAISAILLACGFADAEDAVARGGLQGDDTAYAPVVPRTFYVRLDSCPPLDN